MDGPVSLRSLQVCLDHLIATFAARILDGYSYSQRLAGLQRFRGQLERAILKCRVTQAIAEAPKRFACEISIGAVFHRVVCERRNAVKRCVKSNRQPPRW